MHRWRFIHTGNLSPAENMAIDEAILTAHSEGNVPPTVRFYGWNPPSLSVGYFQKASEEVDFEALDRLGIGYVRRATGGRAVLHDRELTYSLIVSEDYPGLPKSVTEAYRVLSVGLLYGFQNLGLDAEMVTLASEEEKRKYASPEGSSSACFDSPSWYELVVEGRKIAGSAQTRARGVVLQHGSILLDLDADLLFDLLRFPSERIKTRMKESFLRKAVAINELLEAKNLPAVDLPRVEAAFFEGLARGLEAELVPGELTPYERELADRLVREKYGNEEWNHRR
ncbi:biotin/lipoate A/B protein ligase family protein [Paenibacillus thermoaerophilus]|jgi:lipoate-protein ligase A|uniref:Biotin/lipoate A/B protein ligase family protein n=1 Tax=Paenibacillus thermoaerophilus TaxID=1215385 RepID=A0ABW2V689_9BACL|nr:biotin/lipoate A/B protein ligase family protein [Paenibacillus thermoaerophilus]TMV18853.1 lipoate--protein ligase family protein [Paenibacillus thermoaerophilus]